MIQIIPVKKISLRFYFINILFMIGLFSSVLINTKVFAEDTLVVNTDQYTVLSTNVYVLGGSYSGNTGKKPLTTYFELKKDDGDFTRGVEETIKIVRNGSADESNTFFSNPELKLDSDYYFRAVGYYNDAPNKKFYGSINSFRTGFPFPASIPFTGQFGGTKVKIVPYIPPKTAPTFTVSDITSTSVTLAATGLKPNQRYLFKIFSTESGTSDKQATSYGTGLVATTFFGLTQKDRFGNDKDYTAQIFEYDTGTNTITGTGLPALHFTLGGSTDTPATSTPQTDTPGTNTLDIATPATYNNTPSSDNNSPTPNDIVPCGKKDPKTQEIKRPCGFNDVILLIHNVISFIFKFLVIPIAAIMFAYAGILLVSSGGSEEARTKAKGIFTNAVIGLVIATAAYLIVKTILFSVLHYEGLSWF